MNWSSKWPEPTEVQKVVDDQVMFGVGYMQDGKHVPYEQVYKSEEDWAKTNKLDDEATSINAADFVKALDYETRTIEVKYHNKKKVIEVTVVGDLALDFDEDGWNIYHLPTLVCFDNAVPGYEPATMEFKSDNQQLFTYDKLDLLNWMVKVQQSYPTSWQVLRLLKPDDYEDKGKTAKEIIQKWCLSVKVE